MVGSMMTRNRVLAVTPSGIELFSKKCETVVVSWPWDVLQWVILMDHHVFRISMKDAKEETFKSEFALHIAKKIKDRLQIYKINEKRRLTLGISAKYDFWAQVSEEDNLEDKDSEQFDEKKRSKRCAFNSRSSSELFRVSMSGNAIALLSQLSFTNVDNAQFQQFQQRALELKHQKTRSKINDLTGETLSQRVEIIVNRYLYKPTEGGFARSRFINSSTKMISKHSELFCLAARQFMNAMKEKILTDKKTDFAALRVAKISVITIQ